MLYCKVLTLWICNVTMNVTFCSTFMTGAKFEHDIVTIVTLIVTVCYEN